MTALKPRRRLVAVLCALVIAPLWVKAVSEPTSANWTASEHATGSFQAVTVEQPILNSCQTSGILGVLGASVGISFDLPEGYEYDPHDIRWTFGRSAGEMEVVVPSRVAGPDQGLYTATFEYGVLSGVLSVLQDAFYIGAQTRPDAASSASWTSDTAYTRFGRWQLFPPGRDCQPNRSPG